MQPTASLSFVVKAAVAAACIFSSGATAGIVPPAADSVAARQITVDPAQLQALANYISEANAQINNIANEIRSQSSIVLGGWQGSAAAAFQDRLVRFSNDVNDLNGAMGDMANYLRWG
jgi:WXG100 family type VII secretion target